MTSPRDYTLTPANTAALTTLADAKAFAGIAGASEDTYFNALIDVASRSIEAFCGCLLSQRTVVETMYATEPAHNIVLRWPEVSSLASFTCDGESVTLTEITLLKRPGVLRRKDGAPFGIGEFVAGYTAGPAAVDPAVKQAANEFVKFLYESKNFSAAIESENVPDVGETYYRAHVGDASGANGAKLPPVVATLLYPFVTRFNP